MKQKKKLKKIVALALVAAFGATSVLPATPVFAKDLKDDTNLHQNSYFKNAYTGEEIVPGNKGEKSDILEYNPIGIDGYKYVDTENEVDYLYQPFGKPYIFGYPDKTVRPEGNITRAEAVAIFQRIYDGEYPKATNKWNKDKFKDVNESDWFYNSIKKAYEFGLIRGAKGNFNPNTPITKAEFTALVVRFKNEKFYNEANDQFKDVQEGDWYNKAVAEAKAKGWVNGDPSGDFNPDKSISRAEAVTIVNKILTRNITDPQLKEIEGRNEFTDLKTGVWFYKDMVEASLGYYSITGTKLFDEETLNSTVNKFVDTNGREIKDAKVDKSGELKSTRNLPGFKYIGYVRTLTDKYSTESNKKTTLGGGSSKGRVDKHNKSRDEEQKTENPEPKAEAACPTEEEFNQVPKRFFLKMREPKEGNKTVLVKASVWYPTYTIEVNGDEFVSNKSVGMSGSISKTLNKKLKDGDKIKITVSKEGFATEFLEETVGDFKTKAYSLIADLDQENDSFTIVSKEPGTAVTVYINNNKEETVTTDSDGLYKYKSNKDLKNKDIIKLHSEKEQFLNYDYEEMVIGDNCEKFNNLTIVGSYYITAGDTLVREVYSDVVGSDVNIYVGDELISEKYSGYFGLDNIKLKRELNAGENIDAVATKPGFRRTLMGMPVNYRGQLSLSEPPTPQDGEDFLKFKTNYKETNAKITIKKKNGTKEEYKTKSDSEGMCNILLDGYLSGGDEITISLTKKNYESSTDSYTVEPGEPQEPEEAEDVIEITDNLNASVPKSYNKVVVDQLGLLRDRLDKNPQYKGDLEKKRIFMVNPDKEVEIPVKLNELDHMDSDGKVNRAFAWNKFSDDSDLTKLEKLQQKTDKIKLKGKFQDKVTNIEPKIGKVKYSITFNTATTEGTTALDIGRDVESTFQDYVVAVTPNNGNNIKYYYFKDKDFKDGFFTNHGLVSAEVKLDKPLKIGDEVMIFGISNDDRYLNSSTKFTVY